MSAHRQHYFEANLEPRASDAAADPARAPVAGVIAVCMVVVFLAAMGMWHLVQGALTVAPTASESTLVQEARIEGFRAGMATANERGCTAATMLSRPLADE